MWNAEGVSPALIVLKGGGMYAGAGWILPAKLLLLVVFKLPPTALGVFFPDTCAVLFSFRTGEGMAETAGVLARLVCAQEESVEKLLATDALPDMLNQCRWVKTISRVSRNKLNVEGKVFVWWGGGIEMCEEKWVKNVRNNVKMT